MRFTHAAHTYKPESRLGPTHSIAKAPSFIFFIYLSIYLVGSRMHVCLHVCIYVTHVFMRTYTHIFMYISNMLLPHRTHLPAGVPAWPVHTTTIAPSFIFIYLSIHFGGYSHVCMQCMFFCVHMQTYICIYSVCFFLAVCTYQPESRLGPGRGSTKTPSFFFHLLIYLSI